MRKALLSILFLLCTNMAMATTATLIPGKSNVNSYTSAFTELTTTQAATAITSCTGNCINSTNVSDNNLYTLSEGSASVDAYYGVNWTVDGVVNSANITMEGQQEDAGVTCGVAVWNYTSSTWRAGTFFACAANTDVSVTFNITTGMLASYVNASLIRAAFYTNNTAANVLQMDYAGLFVNYNATVYVTNASINVSTAFAGDVVNHTALFNTTGGLTVYNFAWNATGANCDQGFQNVTNNSFSGNLTFAYANITIPLACAGKRIGWTLQANNTDNVFNLTSINTYDVYSYGVLNASISNPPNLSLIPINTLFPMNASVSCLGTQPLCGITMATARYNNSASLPDTNISKVLGDTPMFFTEVIVNNLWNLSSYNYTENITNIALTVRGVFINNSGNRLYITRSGTIIEEYSLSTPWNITTATLVQSKDLSAQDTTLSQIFFNASGNKLYIVGGTNNNVYEYTLSTPWNVTTATFVQSKSVSPLGSTALALFFNAVGTKMYAGSNGGKRIGEYTLSTPWNITTATNINNLSTALNVAAVFINASGESIYVSESSTGVVKRYLLSTPGDLSTATLSETVTGVHAGSSGLFFNGTGSVYYSSSTNGNKIFMYSSPFSITMANPFLCNDIDTVGSCNVSWLVNYTGTLGSSYMVDVLFGSSTYPQIAVNSTEDRVVCGGFCPGAAPAVPPPGIGNGLTLTGSNIFYCTGNGGLSFTG